MTAADHSNPEHRRKAGRWRPGPGARALREIAGRFAVAGRLIAAQPFGAGHINDSFLLTCDGPEGPTRFLLQRVNPSVFPQPKLVMDNIQRVTTHIRRKLRMENVTDARRRVLTVVPARDGRHCCFDERGDCWRMYCYVDGACACDAVQSPAQAERAARAFGTFQRQLADLDGPRLHETIRDFHNTPLRFAALERVVRSDPCRRVARAADEIDFAFGRRPLAGVLLELHRRGQIPERVVHNDAKLSNVLFDAVSGEALCIVDLDTVMPGLSLYDFGDMVRSMTCAAPEDETDLSRVAAEPSLFAALVRGYLEAAGAFLTPVEREHLLTAGKLITLEQGVRFLTDFLSGDTYYRTCRPGHNLDRCRSQFKLLESLERQEKRLRAVVRQV